MQGLWVRALRKSWSIHGREGVMECVSSRLAAAADCLHGDTAGGPGCPTGQFGNSALIVWTARRVFVARVERQRNPGSPADVGGFASLNAGLRTAPVPTTMWPPP